MKVSVITVSFNAADTILDTLDSVAEQSHQAIEHIVIDGESTDGTQEIIESHQSMLAKVVSEPDRGIYDAMNKGLRLATGELIAFLNADDVYADRDVLARVATIVAERNLDAVFGDVIFTSGSEQSGRPKRRYSSRHFTPGRIAWGWMPAHPALFLRHNVYEQFGGFRADYRIAGDFEMVARVFSGGALAYCYIPEVLVRMRPGGVSTKGWRSTWLLNQEVLRACKENGIKTNMLKILSKYPAKLLEYTHLC